MINLSKLYLLGGSSNLGLLGASDLLHSVLLFLLLLSRLLCLLLDHILASQSVLGLKLLGEVHGVINEGKAGWLSTTEVGLEAKSEDAIRSALVHLRDLFADFGFGHRWPGKRHKNIWYYLRKGTTRRFFLFAYISKKLGGGNLNWPNLTYLKLCFIIT